MSLPVRVRGRDIAVLAVGLLTTAIMVVGVRLLSVSATTAALALLLVVLGTSTFGRLWIAIVVALAATLALNFFFLPPVGTFTIADPQNWIALFAFLATAVIACNLSAAAQARASDAIARRNEVTRLFDLTRDVLLTTETVGPSTRWRDTSLDDFNWQAWRFACLAITVGASIRAVTMKCG